MNKHSGRLMAVASALVTGVTLSVAPAAMAAAAPLSSASVSASVVAPAPTELGIRCQKKHKGDQWRWHTSKDGKSHWDYKPRNRGWQHRTWDTEYCEDDDSNTGCTPAHEGSNWTWHKAHHKKPHWDKKLKSGKVKHYWKDTTYCADEDDTRSKQDDNTAK